MYFESIPKIYYDSMGTGNPKVVTNLLRRVAVRAKIKTCLLYTSPSPRDRTRSRMPSSA